MGSHRSDQDPTLPLAGSPSRVVLHHQATHHSRPPPPVLGRQPTSLRPKEREDSIVCARLSAPVCRERVKSCVRSDQSAGAVIPNPWPCLVVVSFACSALCSANLQVSPEKRRKKRKGPNPRILDPNTKGNLAGDYPLSFVSCMNWSRSV